MLTPDFHPPGLPAHVEADLVLRLIDRLLVLPPLLLALLSWQLGGWPWLGAFCLSTTVLFHAVASVNSVAQPRGQLLPLFSMAPRVLTLLLGTQ